MRIYQRIRAARDNPQHDLMDDGDAKISLAPRIDTDPLRTMPETATPPPVERSNDRTPE